MDRRTWRVVTFVLMLASITGWRVLADDIRTSDQGEETSSERRIFRSAHFIVRTDLSQAEVDKALERMEAALAFAAHYWRREPRGQIRCIIARDPKNWPDSALPHPLARVWIGGVGGATISEKVGAGRSARIRATVYASDQPGVVEHEVIHAYCAQTFGTSGPDWYKEGMAEFAVFGHDRSSGVNCPPELTDVLRNERPIPVRQVIRSDLHIQRICDSMDAMLANRLDVSRHVALDAWTGKDAEEVRRAKRAYLWSWALCHMMNNNPNYQERFRSLGRNLLQKKQDSFEQAFEPVMDRLDFEFAFFVNRVEVGYRVDLCGWDWDKRFRHSDDWRLPYAQVTAAHGYQATGLTVTKGQPWKYRTEGNWSTSGDGSFVDTDGGPTGRGRLMGIVLNDYRLSLPFELGMSGEFVAPASGNLYVRCRDDWSHLADNRGQIDVWFTRLAL